MTAFARIAAMRIGPSLIDGDTVAARWKFTFTGNDGSVRTLGGDRGRPGEASG